ncbi:MAG: tRNA lysidine(34) synthetase TilS [Hyphomicrobiales bacterium]
MTGSPLDRVRRFAEQEALFRRAKLVLAAVSGGPDSVAALLLLLKLREHFGFDVQVVHFDHMLRPESQSDLEFVRDLAGRLGVPFLSGEGDVRAAARQQRAGIEDTARKMRYQFLGFVAGEKRADSIATAHTADDQVETVLMRIIRGTGVRGVRGMLPSSPVPGASAHRLVRPLLPLTRADTLQVCAEAGIEPLRDASNDELQYTRNRIRHEALPALRAISPGVDRALLGLAESAREAFGATERRSFEVQPIERTPVGSVFDLEPVAALPSEALGLVLEREASFYNLPIETNRTRVRNARQVLRSGTGQVAFGGVLLDVSCGRVRIGPAMEAESFEPKVLNVPGITIAGPWKVEVRTDPLDPQPGASLAAIDTAGQKGALRGRQLQPGDRMIYHAIDRKVSDVLANAHVPSWNRLGALAIADSARVLAVLTSAGTFEADRSGGGDDLLYVRVSPAQQQQPPRLTLPS